MKDFRSGPPGHKRLRVVVRAIFFGGCFCQTLRGCIEGEGLKNEPGGRQGFAVGAEGNFAGFPETFGDSEPLVY